MKKLLAALAIVLFCTSLVWAQTVEDPKRRIIALFVVEDGTTTKTKAQFYNPEHNLAPIKITFTLGDQGINFTWELLDAPSELVATIEPTIAQE